MIPRRLVLEDREVVVEAFAWCDRTLGLRRSLRPFQTMRSIRTPCEWIVAPLYFRMFSTMISSVSFTPTGLDPGSGIHTAEHLLAVGPIGAISIDVLVNNIELGRKKTQVKGSSSRKTRTSKRSHSWPVLPGGQNAS